jgi:hypothetical protein
MSDLKSSALFGMSKHERKFLMLWHALNGPELTPEYQFTPPRRWRFDFAFIGPEGIICGLKVAIELEGSVWQRGGGRHTRGAGFEQDCVKYFEAAMQDWTVVRLTEKQITAPPSSASSSS